MDLNQSPSKFLELLPDNIVDKHQPEELFRTMTNEEKMKFINEFTKITR